MEDKEKQTKVFDILDKIEFFQGQRAGRELWNDKPKEVQDKDISDFVRDIKYIRAYLQDSVVLSNEEWKQIKNSLYYSKEELEKKLQRERKKTVKEILQKVKEKALSHCRTINCYELTFIETTIDELLKEYEK